MSTCAGATDRVTERDVWSSPQNGSFARFRGLVLALLFACVEPACESQPRPIAANAASRAPAPEDRGELCADLGLSRVCWHDGAAAIVPRPIPDGPVPPAGWRCDGVQQARRCEDRQRNAGPFVCDAAAQRCVQAFPRKPDDGEWDCVDMAGIVFCMSRIAAAGVAVGPPDAGWLCGARRGSSSGERVCVDLAPDLPNPREAFRCTFEYPHGRAERVCARAQVPRAGAACRRGRECPAGMRCESGACVPPQPRPTCWLDADCAAGACRWGTCVEKIP